MKIERVIRDLVSTSRIPGLQDKSLRVVEDHTHTSEAGITSSDLDVETVLRADAWARSRAREVLGLERNPA